MITMRTLSFALGLAVAVLVGCQTVQLAEGEENSAAPEIVYNDSSTWPVREQGLVRFFSIEAHQQQIGFSLEKRVQSADRFHWHWTANGWSGTIWVSVRSSVREAHDALVSTLVLDMIPPNLYAPSGKMVGDICWLSQGSTFLGFCRRNVAVGIDIKEREGSDALNELTRLSKSIVDAIDSEELVKEMSLIRCPKIEVYVPDTLAVGDGATIRIAAREPKDSELQYHCDFIPRGLTIVNGGPYFTTAGEVLYTCFAKKAGEVAFTVYATDVHGMTRTVKKTIRIVGQVRIQAPDQNKASCTACGALVPPGSEKCPRCGAILNLTN